MEFILKLYNNLKPVFPPNSFHSYKVGNKLLQLLLKASPLINNLHSYYLIIIFYLSGEKNTLLWVKTSYLISLHDNVFFFREIFLYPVYLNNSLQCKITVLYKCGFTSKINAQEIRRFRNKHKNKQF